MNAGTISPHLHELLLDAPATPLRLAEWQAALQQPGGEDKAVRIAAESLVYSYAMWQLLLTAAWHTEAPLRHISLPDTPAARHVCQSLGLMSHPTLSLQFFPAEAQ